MTSNRTDRSVQWQQTISAWAYLVAASRGSRGRSRQPKNNDDAPSHICHRDENALDLWQSQKAVRPLVFHYGGNFVSGTSNKKCWNLKRWREGYLGKNVHVKCGVVHWNTGTLIPNKGHRHVQLGVKIKVWGSNFQRTPYSVDTLFIFSFHFF